MRQRQTTVAGSCFLGLSWDCDVWFGFSPCFILFLTTEVHKPVKRKFRFNLLCCPLRLSPYLSRKGEFHCLWQMLQVGFYILRDKDLVEHCDL